MHSSMSCQYNSSCLSPISSSFHWEGGWLGSLESMIAFNLLTVLYDSLRVSTTFAHHLVMSISYTKLGLTSGIASSFDTVIEVAPHDFAHRATSQSRWDRKGAQSESETSARRKSYIEDPRGNPAIAVPAAGEGKWSTMTVDPLSNVPASA